MSKIIAVVSYDDNWPRQYTLAAGLIHQALTGDLLNLHHVGSTAVPGLAAKPTIDIIAEVKSLTFNDEQLIGFGYLYRGGFNLPLRKSYTKRSPDIDVNLHVFERDDPEIELNLRFRDYLRNHQKTRGEYQALKYALIKEESSHQKQGGLYKGYTLGKHDLIRKILKASGFNRLRFVICEHYSEWEAVKALRLKYFFKNEDPYTWTFNHPEHLHFALYQGVDIVGYAHLQLWPEQRAAIRIIVIDETKRSNGLGTAFLGLIEKLMKLRGYKSVHTQSRPESEHFYRINNYVDLPFNDPENYPNDPQDIELGKVL